jgi:hypothetical protein
MPGDVGYVVVDESGDAESELTQGSDGIPVTTDGPWYSRLWASVEAADAVPPDGAE